MLLPVVLLCSCFPESDLKVSHKEIVAGIKAPTYLQFSGETYKARYSTRDEDTCVVEYYRTGERKSSWTRMLALRVNDEGLNSMELAGFMESSAKTNKASAVRSFKGKNKEEYGLEFTLMQHKVVELDVFRFAGRTNGTGTITFQYTEKMPFKKLREVGEAKLPEYYAGIRKKVLDAMEATPTPKIEMVPR
jgi:hypothetical protein